MNNHREQYLEKALPSSPDSEKVCVGSVILDNDVILQCVEKYLSPDDFYSPLHRRVYKAQLSLFEQGMRIDPILIGEEIKKETSLDALGGTAVITNLTHGLPHFSDIYDYIKVVKDKCAARNLIKTCGATISEVLSEETPIADSLDNAEQMIYDLRDGDKGSGVHISTLVDFSLKEKIARAQKSQDRFTLSGISTGFKRLDEHLSGLKKKNLILVGGRPGMAKSAIFFQIAQNTIDDDKEAVVLIFSLEMSKEEVADRMMCQDARIDLHRFQNGYMVPSEWDRANTSREWIGKKRIIVDDTPALTALEIKARARHLKLKEKRLDLVLVDYLDLVKKPNRQQKHTELKDVTIEMKQMSKQLDVPVGLIHHLNRDCEKRHPPKPILSDLREAGEEDADVVLLIYREEYYKDTILKNKNVREGVAEILIAKNRNGPTGIVELAFLKEYTRFENLQE